MRFFDIQQFWGHHWGHIRQFDGRNAPFYWTDAPMSLTDTKIRNVKATGKTQKLFDGGGLYLEVSPTGRKWWRLKYRYNKTEKRLSIGVYPNVTLLDARIARDMAKKQISQNIDPSLNKQAEKAQIASQGETFETVSLEWYQKQASVWVPSYSRTVIGRLRKDALPWLGKLPVGDITPKMILACLNRLADRGAVESARRLLNNLDHIFQYAIASDRCGSNPAAGLIKALPPVKTKHLASITDVDKIPGLLRSIDAYEGTLIVKCALQLAPLTFVRPGELRNAEWSEIDLQTAIWSIPASKMKMREPLIVPLSKQALAILTDLKPLTGNNRYVFPSLRTPLRPMSDNAVLSALRRMGFAKDEMSGHGFRAMARTVMDEVLGVRTDILEQQLGHAVRDPNGRAYNRTKHMDARREMMQKWADYLEQLKQG